MVHSKLSSLSIIFSIRLYYLAHGASHAIIPISAGYERLLQPVAHAGSTFQFAGLHWYA